MEGVRCSAPVDPIGPHAGPVEAGEQVAAPRSSNRTAEAGAGAAPHGGLQRNLDQSQRPPKPPGLPEQSLQQRGGTPGENLGAPPPARPPGARRTPTGRAQTP